MWQIGVDVLPDTAGRGVAAALTSRLAAETLARGKVPFYCAAWSNIKSVRNAVKCGFVPAWAELTAKARGVCAGAERAVTRRAPGPRPAGILGGGARAACKKKREGHTMQWKELYDKAAEKLAPRAVSPFIEAGGVAPPFSPRREMFTPGCASTPPVRWACARSAAPSPI